MSEPVDLVAALESVLGYRPRSERRRPMSTEDERALDVPIDHAENVRDAAERGEEW